MNDNSRRSGRASSAPPPAGAAVVSSATGHGSTGVDHVAGRIPLAERRLDERTAREVLDRLFGAADLQLEHDHTYRRGEALVRIDGYDPVALVGYQFVSHHDADVVTDFDDAAERTMRALDEAGKLRLLIVHDDDVADVEALIAVAEDFLASLDRTDPG
jgi:hypothetical protein